MGMIAGRTGGDWSSVEAMLRSMVHRVQHDPRVCLRQCDGAVLGASENGIGSEGPITIAGDADLFGYAGSESLSIDELAQLWHQQGREVLCNIDGLFAIAVHDDRDGSITLARDICGARPVVYTSIGDSIVFASECKGLLGLDGFEPRVDLDVLQHIHNSKFAPADRTMFAGVRAVAPSSYVVIRSGKVVESGRYWKPEPAVEDLPFEAHADRIEQAFLSALDRRSRIVDPLAVALSGGIDSMAIVAGLRRLNPGSTILTFSAGDREDDEELLWSGKVAERFGCEHTPVVVGADAIKPSLMELVWRLEAPIARTESLMTMMLSRAASRRADVLFTGDIADGLFGGMPRHKLPALAGKVPMSTGVLEAVYQAMAVGQRPRGVVRSLGVKMALRSKVPPAPRVLGADHRWPAPMFVRGGGDPFNTFLADGLCGGALNLMIKSGMVYAGSGVRTCSPFSDPGMISAAMRVPSRFKHDGRRGKIIWREVAGRLLPSEMASRPKRPQRMTESPEVCAALNDLAGEYLSRDAVRRRGWFDADEVESLVRRPASGCWRPEHAMRIWTLVLSEIWAGLYLDGQVDRLGKEPVAEFRCRHETRVPPTEPAVAPRSDKVVAPVPNGSGDDQQPGAE